MTVSKLSPVDLHLPPPVRRLRSLRHRRYTCQVLNRYPKLSDTYVTLQKDMLFIKIYQDMS